MSAYTAGSVAGDLGGIRPAGGHVQGSSQGSGGRLLKRGNVGMQLHPS